MEDVLIMMDRHDLCMVCSEEVPDGEGTYASCNTCGHEAPICQDCIEDGVDVHIVHCQECVDS